MKKILALILCLCLACCFVACDGEEGKKDEQGEIDRYASVGEIPEFPVALGMSIEDFKEMFPADYEGADESKVLLHEVEGNTAVCLITLDASYYYEKANADKGISVIAVTGGNVFGLEIGNVTTKSDITARLSAEYTESVAYSDRLYFFPSFVEQCEMLTAEFDNFRLDFFFQEDFLVAATLTDTNNWTD